MLQPPGERCNLSTPTIWPRTVEQQECHQTSALVGSVSSFSFSVYGHSSVEAALLHLVSAHLALLGHDAGSTGRRPALARLRGALPCVAPAALLALTSTLPRRPSPLRRASS
ncbi:hypothetical protein PVAP13_4NG208100 [Panicum virgatum]|uniref:Uncharacterized protein n=1 Tax=Panicum virgatum TaxID=38727 RepID=A0A8T0TFV1_PANVG|nr:hypothetical protein PVAP13_4NG208100 [Panicum virgatum]